MLLAALAWPAVAAAAFPVRVSPNGRYLVDGGGVPWRMQVFAAWVMSVKGTTSNIPGYLDQIRAQGFNAIQLMAMVHGANSWPEVSGAPINANGDAPFTTPGDFTTPNAAYWNHLDWMIDQCATRGIAVLLTAAYLGYPSTGQGWWAETDAQTQAQLQAYGTWLGTRYASKSNIIWFALGDQTPTGTRETKHLAMIDAIKAVAPQPWMAEAMGGNSSPALASDTSAPIASRIDMHSFYGKGPTGYGECYEKSDQSYSASPPRPAYLQESNFENDVYSSNLTGASWESQRNRLWAVLSGGIAGDTFGTYNGWRYVTSAFPIVTNGTAYSTHAFNLFATIPWWDMVPQPSWNNAGARTTPVIVTAGRGSRTGSPPDWIVASRSSTGSHILAYVPPTGTGTRTFDVDTSLMSGTYRARWWDPSSGGYTTIGAYTNAGTRSFTTPGANSSGSRNDWVLVLDVRTVGGALTISPADAKIGRGGTIQFTASGGKGTGYAWSFATNASGGSITATGLYTAGLTGDVTDVVRLTDSAALTTSQNVTVTAGHVIVDIAPKGLDPLVVLAVVAVVTGGLMVLRAPRKGS